VVWLVGALQNHRTQAKNRAELDDGGEPAKSDGDVTPAACAIFP
jgi:hypothetical protein